MNIPRNGRVVVIDDVPAEGLPLVRVLSKNKIPAAYFTGLNKDELPDKPISGVRIVFLDIILGTDGQNDKTKISTAVGVLKRIIEQKKTSPYILVAWTKHEELVSKVKEGLKDNCPVLVLNLRKNDCKYQHGGYNLKKIERKIREELKKAGAFHLFSIWENLVHESAGEIVDELSAFYPKDANWNKNISSVIVRLAEAYAGEHLDKNNSPEICKNALLTFNSAFIDGLEENINKCRDIKDAGKFSSSSVVSENICATINTKLLFVTEDMERNAEPGNIYRNTINSVRKAGLEDLFAGTISSYTKKDNFVKNIINVAVEVSPPCDHACKKLKMHRILPGVFWPKEDESKIKSADYIFKSPAFAWKDKHYRLVLDFRYLTSVTPFIMKKASRPFMKVRGELLSDILAGIAKHVNRPGVTSV